MNVDSVGKELTHFSDVYEFNSRLRLKEAYPDSSKPQEPN